MTYKLVKCPSIHPYGVNIFKTLRLQDRWADVNETWHVILWVRETNYWEKEF